MANSLNKVQIIGNVTRDFELKQTKGGDAICSVDIATNHPVKGDNGEWTQAPDYHSVVLWGRLAEIAAQYLKKGDKVYFEGALQTRSWEADDGSKRYKTEIKGKEMILLGSKRNDEREQNEAYARSKKEKSIDEIADEMNSAPQKPADPQDDLPF